jgi:hypothetical protein
MRRSLLVTVPVFSPQVVAGSSRSAKSQVLAVPLLDWFRPWQYRLSVAAEVANKRAAVSKSSLLMPQVCDTSSGV